MAIILLTFLAYYKALENKLVWDSLAYIKNNHNITQLNLENITWMFTTNFFSNWHPITWLSYALDHCVYDDFIWGLHLTNIIFHTLNSLLVFFLALVTLGLAWPDKTNHYPIRFDGSALMASFFAAVFFAVHPQHVESVAWVAERKDVLSLFFILATFLCYLQYVISNQYKWYISTLLLFTLALLSKPMAVTIPAVLLIIDVYPIRRTPFLKPIHYAIKTTSFSRLALEKIPFFVLTIFTILMTLKAQAGAMLDVSLQLRLLNALDSIFLYLRKLIFPFNFSPLYPHPFYNQSTIDFLDYIHLFGFLACTGLTLALWYKKHFAWLSTWGFYLVTLSPMRVTWPTIS